MAYPLVHKYHNGTTGKIGYDHTQEQGKKVTHGATFLINTA